MERSGTNSEEFLSPQIARFRQVMSLYRPA
jgi:hypothetical protein